MFDFPGLLGCLARQRWTLELSSIHQALGYETVLLHASSANCQSSANSQHPAEQQAAMTVPAPESDWRNVALFGGAIIARLPLRFLDISDLRPVPDHQEVCCSLCSHSCSSSPSLPPGLQACITDAFLLLSLTLISMTQVWADGTTDQSVVIEIAVSCLGTADFARYLCSALDTTQQIQASAQYLLALYGRSCIHDWPMSTSVPNAADGFGLVK